MDPVDNIENEVNKREVEKFSNVLILQSVYNGERYLPTQLESIINQEKEKVSLYVRDDGSSDNSLKVIQEYAKRIPILFCKGQNIGPAKSFMQLIEMASGEYEYYAFADQDDYWQNNKLYVAISQLEKYSEKPALYYSCTKRVGSNLEEIEDPYKKNYHTERFPDVLILTEAPGCTMVFNKKLLKILKRYNPEIIFMHDQWVLQVCAAVGGKIIYDEQSYILYRQHSDNVMAGLEKMNYNSFNLFKYRIQKFLDFTYKPSLAAAELKNGYFDLMDDNNKKLVQILSDAPNKIKNRFYIIFTNKFRTPYFIYNLKFMLQIFFNKC